MYIFRGPLQVYIGERIVKINQIVQNLWNFSQYLSKAPRINHQEVHYDFTTGVYGPNHP